jgi:uncharacterized protein YjbJ (UPF0337 family)
MAGRKEKVQGKAMEMEGKATGDKIRETEGKALHKVGEAKSGAARATDKLEGATRKSKSK